MQALQIWLEFEIGSMISLFVPITVTPTTHLLMTFFKIQIFGQLRLVQHWDKSRKTVWRYISKRVEAVETEKSAIGNLNFF